MRFRIKDYLAMRTAYQIWLFDTSITKQELQFKEDS